MENMYDEKFDKELELLFREQRVRYWEEHDAVPDISFENFQNEVRL